MLNRLLRRAEREGAAVGRWGSALLNLPQKLWYATRGAADLGPSLPDFICLGAQKGGTSWLMTMLSRHPGIFLPAGLPHFDIHYFDRHFHRPLHWYAGFFRDAGQRIKGENTPAYGLLPDWKVSFVRRLLPELRLVLMIRNPVDRAWSHALMNFVHDLGRDFATLTDDELIAHFQSSRSKQRGDYLAILDRWERFYPASQIHVEVFDRISADPHGLLVDVLNHIGVTAGPTASNDELSRVVNPGSGHAMPDRLRAVLESIYAEPIERLHDRFGERVASWRCTARESVR